jgi:hypothetical protein
MTSHTALSMDRDPEGPARTCHLLNNALAVGTIWQEIVEQCRTVGPVHEDFS